MYDFGGMDARMGAFRTFEPSEGYPIRQLQYNRKGDLILVITGSPQPKVSKREKD